MEFSVPRSLFDTFDKRGKEVVYIPFHDGRGHDDHGRLGKKFWRTVVGGIDLGYWITERLNLHLGVGFL